MGVDPQAQVLKQPRPPCGLGPGPLRIAEAVKEDVESTLGRYPGISCRNAGGGIARIGEGASRLQALIQALKLPPVHANLAPHLEAWGCPQAAAGDAGDGPQVPGDVLSCSRLP